MGRVWGTDLNKRVQFRVIFARLAAAGVVGRKNIVVSEIRRYAYNACYIRVSGRSRGQGRARRDNGRGFVGSGRVVGIGV
jgi:hypothetical protein